MEVSWLRKASEKMPFFNRIRTLIPLDTPWDRQMKKKRIVDPLQTRPTDLPNAKAMLYHCATFSHTFVIKKNLWLIYLAAIMVSTIPASKTIWSKDKNSFFSTLPRSISILNTFRVSLYHLDRVHMVKSLPEFKQI